MNRTLTLVSARPEAADAAWRKLAEFLGLGCAAASSPTRADSSAGTVATTTARTLLAALDGAVTRDALARLLPRGPLLVRDFAASETAPLLTALTDGAITATEQLPAGRQTQAYAAALATDAISLAGLEHSATNGARCVFVVGRPDAALVPLVTIAGRPLLVRLRVGETDLFLFADGALADLDEPCGSAAALAAAHASLLPAAIFLRLALRDACWSDPFPAANLVIDDPRLRERHGFVAYRTLLAEAEAHGYAATIAFVPFNHRRSDPRTVAFLRGHAARFSIAVHGCDHTGGEFAITEPARLRHIGELALARMRDHEARSGMPFDPIMVFPQGKFSAPAFAALGRSGYHAVVNTEFLPQSAAGAPALRVRDLLDGAITAYGGPPLFRRHYPVAPIDFAIDLFWGRPVLLVEHHGYFKDGYPRLADFVRRLGALDARLAWKPLGEVVAGHALYRTLGPDRVAVKFFPPRAVLRNAADAPMIFSIEKPEPEPEGVAEVTADGAPIPFRIESGVLRAEVRLAARASCTIQVVHRRAPPAPFRLPLGYRCAAAARRYLSDFRDNHLARHSRLLAIATRLKGLLRRR
jgi:hypothetical protein